jgi:hypothetical protein
MLEANESINGKKGKIEIYFLWLEAKYHKCDQCTRIRE